MSISSKAYKLLCKAYRSILQRCWFRNHVVVMHPARDEDSPAQPVVVGPGGATTMETLEPRLLLSATWVDNSWIHDAGGDLDNDGTISAGDIVIFDAGGAQEQGGLVYETDAFDSIQSAIDSAVAPDTVYIGTGTFAQNVTISHDVDLIGLGSGDDPLNSTILTGDGSSSAIVTLTGSGTSQSDPLILQDLRITPDGVYGVNVPSGSISNLLLDNVHVVGASSSSIENEVGLKVATYAGIDGLTVVDSAFDQNDYGWYIAKHGDWGPGGSNVTNVVVENTSFSGNAYKGLYTEKLSDATFTDIVVDFNGLVDFWNAKWNGGFDINLKGEETYQNLVFNNAVFTGNAVGFQEGAGLMIKARDDGSTYGASPASLDGVEINGGTFTGNERGIRLGEPGKDNATPTGVEIHGANIYGNTQTYTGTDGSAYGDLVNHTLASANAQGNWWGTATPGANIVGAVDFSGYLLGPAETQDIAVDDDWTSLPDGTSVSYMGETYVVGSNAFDTIGEGISAANANGNVYIASGAYTQSLTINKSLNLFGESADVVTIDSSLYGAYTVTTSAASIRLDGLRIQNTGVGAVGAVIVNSGQTDIVGSILSSPQIGVQVGSAHLAIEDSVVETTGAGIAGVLVSATGSADIHGSDLSSQTGLAIVNDSASAVDASGNWWGTTDEATIASSVVGLVDYTPYLASGTDQETLSGFQGDFSTLYVTDEGQQIGSDGRIQEAVDLVSGSTIYVNAGSYTGTVDIAKDNLTLLGANAGIDPNTGTRGAESILYTDDTYGIYITGGHVTIDGLVIDGDNPAMDDGDPLTDVNGADIDSSYGIYASNPSSNGPLTVVNNIVRNQGSFGFVSWFGDSTISSGNVIANNLFENINNGEGEGRAIAPLWNYYADITDNVVTDSVIGIYFENAHNSDTTDTVTWSGNDISTSRAGIWYNLTYGSASPIHIASNVINAYDDPDIYRYDGIWVTSVDGAIEPVILNNDIDASGTTQPSSGYRLWNNPTTAGITLEGGSVHGADYGVYVDNYEGYRDSEASGTSAVVDGVDISGASVAGVYVHDNDANTKADADKAVSVSLIGGTSISGTGTGVLVEGSAASAEVNGLTLEGFDTGVDVSGGSAEIRNDQISDNTVGVVFRDGGSGRIVGTDFDGTMDNSTDVRMDASAGSVILGSGNTFAGDTYYVDLHTSQDYNLDAAGAGYDLADPFAIEDRMHHALDDGTSGLITVSEGNLYVTTPGTGASDETIANALAAVTDDDILNIQGGIYNETLLFDSAYDASGVTVTGVAGDAANITGGVRFDNDSPIDGITLQDLVITGEAGGGEILQFSNTAAANDLSLHRLIVDGENVSGRNCLAGNLIGGDLSITDSTFRNIPGWAVLDIDSSSDYSPYGGNGLPLGTVTFTGNTIENVNGSVALRGHTPDRTDSVLVSGNTFTNIGGNAGEQGAQWAAIEINHAESVTVTNNTIANVSEGIYGEGQAMQLWDIATLDMTGNVIENNFEGVFVFGGSAGGAYGGPWAIPSGQITGNSFSGNSQYNIKVDGSATGGPLDASGNWWGSTDEATVASMAIGAVDFTPYLASGTDISSDFGFQGDVSSLYVTDEGSQVGSAGRVGEAVQMASTGGTVEVQDGTYAEGVVVDKALTLRGDVGDATAGPGAGAPVLDVGGSTHGIHITASDVTVEGFVVQDARYNGIIVGYGASPSNEFQNVVIRDNLVDTVTGGNGFGMYVGYQSEALPGGPTDDRISDLLDFSGLEVTRNEVTNAANAGLVIQSITSSGSDLLVADNYLHDNAASGVWIDSAQNIDVTGNTLSGNANGIFFSGYGDGYYEGDEAGPYDPRYIDITENTITGNSDSGVLVYDGYIDDIHINQNSISGNGSWGVNRWIGDNPNPLDATYNHWGTDDAAAIEAMINSPSTVDYTPYLDLDTDSIVVDDDWAGLADGEQVVVDSVVYEIGLNAFDTVQEGVATVDADGTVLVLAGDYVTPSQVAIDRNLSVVGEDRTTTVIGLDFDTGSSGDSRGWFLVSDGVTFNLSNVTIDGNGQNVYQAIRTTGSGLVENVAFNNILFNESGPNYSGVAIAAFGASSDVDVLDSTFTNIGRVGVLYYGSGTTGTFAGNAYTGKGAGDWLDYALDISAGATVDVFDNTITGNLGVASSDGSTSAGIVVSTYFGGGTSADIHNNFITGNTTGVFVGYAATDSSEVTIFENDLSGNTTAVDSTAPVVDASGNWFGTTDEATVAGLVNGPVDITPYLASGDVDAMTDGFQGDFSDLYVTDEGEQSGTTGRVQEAVDLVSGSTVHINDGLYLESSITVDSPVTIDGESRSGVVIAPDVAGNNAFDIASSDVTIRDLTIDGEANNVALGQPADANSFQYGILANGGTWNNITLENLNVLHSYRRGIGLFSLGSTGHLIQNTHVADVTELDGIFNYGEGQYIDNVIEDIAPGGGASGIRSYGSGVFESNEVSNAPWAIVADTHGTILNNTIDNVEVGIVMNNGFYGVEASNTLIQGNSITNLYRGGSVMSGVGMSLVNVAGGSLIGGDAIGEGNYIQMSGDDLIGMNVWWNPDGDVRIEGNELQVDGDSIGMMLHHNEMAAAPIELVDNVIAQNSAAAEGKGIYVTDDGPDLGLSYAALSGNTVSGFAVGVDVERINGQAVVVSMDGDVLSDNSVDLHVIGAEVSVTGGQFTGTGTGVLVEGADADVDLSGLTLAGFRDGVHVTDGSISITGSTIEQNTDHGLIVFGDGTVNVIDTTFDSNATGQPIASGHGDVTLYDFNGDATLQNVDIVVDNADYGLQIRGSQVGGGDETPTGTAGTIVLDNVDISGDAVRYGMVVQTYLDASTMSFSDVSINASATYGLAMWDVLGAEINLGNTTFANSHTYDLVASLADMDATASVFLNASQTPLDRAVLDDNFSIEDRVGHAIDYRDPVYGAGLVTWNAGNLYVTPNSYAAPLSNSPSIQRTIDSSSDGDTIHVQDGFYAESNIAVHTSVTIAGQSRAGVLIAPSAEDVGLSTSTFDGDEQIGFLVLSDRVTIRDLTIDGEANNLAQGGVLPDHRNYRVGITNYSEMEDGFASMTVDDVTIRNICRRGIAIWPAGTGGHVVSDSLIENIAAQQAISSSADNILITGNTIRRAGMGIGLFPSLPAGSGETVTVTNNDISEISGAYSEYYGHNWPSVGIYYRNPNYDQTVVISGNDLAIGAGDEAAGLPGVTGMYIYNAGPGSEISGNVIDATAGTNNWGIYLGCSAGVDVSGNEFILNDSDSGMYLGRGVDGTPTQNVIDNNIFTTTDAISTGISESTAILQANDGSVFWMVEDPKDTDNIISNNTITGFVRGIVLDESDTMPANEVSATITGNTISQGNTGVVASGPVEASLAGNILSGNTVGVQVSGGAVVDLGGGTLGSAGNNDLHGYTGGSGNYAVENLNVAADGDPDVSAENNNWGPIATPSAIEGVVYDDTDDAALTEVIYSNPQNLTSTQADTVYVDDDWAGMYAFGDSFDHDSDSGTADLLWGYDAFAVIQDGINAVADGGEVSVLPGTYTANGEALAVIDKSLTLSGHGEGLDDTVDTILTGGVYGSGEDSTGLGIAWPRAIVIQADDVTVQNLRISDFMGNDVDTGGYGIVARAQDAWGVTDATLDNIMVTNITFHDVLYGVRGQDTVNLVVENTTFGLTTHTPASGGYAYYLSGTSDGGSAGTVVRNNVVDGSSIWVTATSDAIIEDNVVTDANYNAIWLGQQFASGTSSSGIIRNNVVNGAYEAGIVVWNIDGESVGGISITDNVVTNAGNPGWNPNGGIAVYSVDDTPLEILRNEVTGTGSSGLNVMNSTLSDAVIANNLITDSGLQGALFTNVGFAGVEFFNNAIEDGLVITGGSGDLQASANWWGSNAPAAVKAAANGGVRVDYTPWLDSGTDVDGGSVGFEGDFTTFHVDDDSIQTGTSGRIGEAIDLVTNSTVYVHAGTYTESVLIDKSLQLLGDGPASTTIDASGLGGAVAITASDVTVDGFEILGDASTVYGLYINGGDAGLDNISITNNAIHGMAQPNSSATPGSPDEYMSYGILADSKGASQWGTLTNLAISDNNIYDIGDGVASGGYGLNLYDVDGATISGNAFSDLASSPALTATAVSVSYAGTGSSSDPYNGLAGVSRHVSISGNTYTNVLNGISLISDSTSSITEAISDFSGVDRLVANGGDNTDRATVSLTGANAMTDNLVLPALQQFWLTQAGHDDTDGYFDTIQSAIDASDTAAGVHISAGVFTENVQLDKHVDLLGTGTGTDSSANTILRKLTNGPIIHLVASGSSSDAINIESLRIEADNARAFSLANGVDVSHLSLDDVVITGTNAVNTQETGFYVEEGGSVRNLSVRNSEFRDLYYGFLGLKENGGSDVIEDVQFTNVLFDNNNSKGLYVEKLSNATFTDVTVTNNGSNQSLMPAWAQAWGAGFDINLKFGDYSQLVFQNLTVTGNGLDAAHGAGLTIKARGNGDDIGGGGTYAANPATLQDVQILGGSYTGNESAIRIGEPGMANTSPTGVVMDGSDLSGNVSTGLAVVGGEVSISGVDLTGNRIGLYIAGDATVDAGSGVFGSVGGNDFSGYSTSDATSGAIVMASEDGGLAGPQTTPPDASARGNTFTAPVEDVIYHDADDNHLAFVDYDVLSALSIDTDISVLDEGGTVELSGSFVNDPQAHTVEITWGDGQSDLLHLAQGFFDFTLAHTYADDDPASGTPSDVLPIDVVVTEDVAGGDSVSATASVTVNNVAPSVAIDGVPASASENDPIHLTASVSDPGTDSLTYEWVVLKDGVLYASGASDALSFTPDDNATYDVTLTVTDDDTGETTVAESIVVANVAPDNLALSVDATVDENGSVTLDGTFTDPGTADTHTVTILWDDGTSDTIHLTGGERDFSATHQYLDDNPSGTASDVRTIDVTVEDDDLDPTVALATTTVQNVAPVLDNVQLDQTTITEGDTVTLTGTLSDVGTQDSFTMVIDWGDGTVQTETPTTGAFSFSHTYEDDDPSTGTPSDVQVVTVTVTDDDTGSDVETASVTVNNVAPVVDILGAPASSPEGTEISLTSSVVDSGDDTFSYDWQVLKNGLLYDVGSDPNFSFTPDDNGTYDVHLTVTDDDTGVGTDSASIAVTDVTPSIDLLGADDTDEGAAYQLTLENLVDPGDDPVSLVAVSWGDLTPSTTFDPATNPLPKTLSHVYDDGDDTPTITVSVFNDDGVHIAGSKTLTVHNVAPTATILTGGAVDEGDPGFVELLMPMDPSNADVSTGFTYSYDFNQDGDFADAGEGANLSSNSSTIPGMYLADDPSADVDVYIHDKDGGTTQYTVTIPVQNVAPVVDAGGNGLAYDGVAFTRTVSFTDPGDDSPWTVRVDWDGDSTVDETFTTSTQTFDITHTFDPSATPATYSVTVEVDDGSVGGVNSDAFDVTVVENTFRVTDFHATPSGFDVTFNRSPELDVLNLYDGNDTPVDLPDMSVLLNGTTTINGSMVWDATENTMSFVKTDGVLADGNYSVSLASRTDGFKDSAGSLLDGNTDYVAGGDYTTTFSVSHGTARVVSIPDIARGAGQDVDVPATSAGLPIRIDNATGVTAVDVDVVYDTSLLSLGNAVKASGLPADWTVTQNLVPGGRLRLTLSGTTPLNGSDVDLVYLDANVPDDAPYGASQVVRLENLRVNEDQVASVADSAIHKAVYLGDVSGNAAYTAFDPSLISNVVVGLETGFDASDWIDPLIVGDTTGDGTLSGQDASLTAQKAALMTVPQIPDIPTGITLVAVDPGIDPELSIPENILAYAGGPVTVPLNIDVEAGAEVSFATVDVFYDTNILSIEGTDVHLGSDWTSQDGWSLTANADTGTPGQLRLVFFNSQGNISAEGPGEIAELIFHVDAGAAEGLSVLDVESADSDGGLTWTQDDGSVQIDVAPVVKAFQRAGRPDELASVSLSFSEDVSGSIDVGDLGIVEDQTGLPVDMTGASVSYDALTDTATWDLSTLDLEYGYYTLVLSADGVTDGLGMALDGNADGVPGDDWSTQVLVATPGDADLDGDVDANDLATVGQNWSPTPAGKTWANGDFNDDGRVDSEDLAAIGLYWNPAGASLGGSVAESVPATTSEPLSTSMDTTGTGTMDLESPSAKTFVGPVAPDLMIQDISTSNTVQSPSLANDHWAMLQPSLYLSSDAENALGTADSEVDWVLDLMDPLSVM